MGKSYDSSEHQKAWKIYLFAVAGALVMSYLNELLMYLMFRGEVSFQAGAFTLRGLGEIFGMTILGVLASVEMLGEELGWLGWLFPKLEKLHGTKAAILLLALIRTIWHLGILIFLPHPLIGLCDLFLSNLLSQGFLVYLTKECIAVSSGGGTRCNKSAPCIGGIQRFILSGAYRTNERCRAGFGGCCRRNQLSADAERQNVCAGRRKKNGKDGA